MRKQLFAGLIVVGALAAFAPSTVRATTAAPTVCMNVDAPAGPMGDPGLDYPRPTGPSRAPHTTVDIPLCNTISALCIILVPGPKGNAGLDFPIPGGPARVVHPAAPVACPGIDPACQIVLTGPKGPPGADGVDTTAGASRTVHSPTGVAPLKEVPIPEPCQAVLASLVPTPTPTPTAIPATGGNSAPLVLIAASLVLAGGLVVLGQRRLARR